MTRTHFGDMSHPTAQAFRLLHVAFVVAPIVAGLDKFLNLLVFWPKYLAPWIPNLLHVAPQTFMYGVGVIEIVAGILVALAPRYFAFLVTVWLWGIIVNLLTYSGYYDIALRDFGLSLGSLALGRLAQAQWAETHMVEDVDTVNETTYRAPRPTTAATTPTATEVTERETTERRAA